MIDIFPRSAWRRRGTLKDGRANEYVVDHRWGTEALQARTEAFASQLGPIVQAMREERLSLRQIGARVRECGIKTARGGACSANAVRAVLLRQEGAQGQVLRFVNSMTYFR